MRTVVLAGLLAAFGTIAPAAPVPTEWKLPKADGDKWAARVKKVVGRDDWTVTADGNEIVVKRNKPVSLARLGPNAAPNEKPAPAGERTPKFVLRFAPKLSLEDYEQLVAVNEASDKERDRLHRAVNLPHKFDEFIAKTPEEVARVRAYHEAVAKLRFHDLPDLYTPDHSVFFFEAGDGWTFPADETDRAVTADVRETLKRYFGMYSPSAASGGGEFGRYIPDPRR